MAACSFDHLVGEGEQYVEGGQQRPVFAGIEIRSAAVSCRS
jgi:hypothetical protein